MRLKKASQAMINYDVYYEAAEIAGEDVSR